MSDIVKEMLYLLLHAGGDPNRADNARQGSIHDTPLAERRGPLWFSCAGYQLGISSKPLLASCHFASRITIKSIHLVCFSRRT